MEKESTTLIAGGGVIGLCSAYFLAKAGHRVLVVDRDPAFGKSCSDRNAGMVVPSHFIPLAAPGVVTQGLKWMFRRKSPFYLKPRFSPSLWQWCWQFFRHANRRHVLNTQELLRDLSLESRELFSQLSEELDFPLVERGLLMLCQTEAAFREEEEVAEAANALGVRAEVCSPERLEELDPDMEMAVAGGVWFPQDAHLDPMDFLKALQGGILRLGGEIRKGEINSFDTGNRNVRSVELATGEEIPADRLVIAGGAWSPELASALRLRLPMQAGKGYSFTLETPPQLPALCSVMKEGRVAVTPMGESLRVAGTMEIGGNDLSIDPVRLQGIIESFCRFFPAFVPGDFVGQEPWAGLRPCTPDGLPYIGRVPGFDNVVVATGHAMLGLSLGPVTGRVVCDLFAREAGDRRIDPARF